MIHRASVPTHPNMRTPPHSGISNRIHGGPISIRSGRSKATSSGDTTLGTANAGLAGTSGEMRLATGTSSLGNTGTMSFATGHASTGRAGQTNANDPYVVDTSLHRHNPKSNPTTFLPLRRHVNGDGGDLSWFSGVTQDAAATAGSASFEGGEGRNQDLHNGGDGGGVALFGGEKLGASAARSAVTQCSSAYRN